MAGENAYGPLAVSLYIRRFGFEKPLACINLHGMKFSSRLIIFVVMFALAGQGIVPGLVLCQGEEGHATLEMAFDRCCASSLRTSVQSRSTYFLDAVDLAAQDGCGPCSDTPILANPLRLPARGWNGTLIQAQPATIVTGSVTDCVKVTLRNWLFPLINPLIPIQTSVLLI